MLDTQEKKDIFDTLLAGTKKADAAFTAYWSAKLMTDPEDLDLRMEINGILRDLIDMEQRAISLMMRLNNEISDK